MLFRICLLAYLSFATVSAETITGTIFCDNQFEFYFNGNLIATDPLDFTPHNAVKVSFEYDGTSRKTYAIMCQDYASGSGYEYIETSNPQLGDGNLLAEFSDGTRTSTSWKAYTVTFGPTDASISNGCSASNLGACAVEDRGMPDNWYASDFDDSGWVAATEYTVAQAGWGKPPSYSDGNCGTITSPLTKQNADPSSKATTADECLDPRHTLCGGDQACDGDDGRMLWGADLERDNKMLFRYTASASSSASTGASDPTPAPASAGATSDSAATPAPTAAADSTATPAPTAAAASASSSMMRTRYNLALALLLGVSSFSHSML